MGGRMFAIRVFIERHAFAVPILSHGVQTDVIDVVDCVRLARYDFQTMHTKKRHRFDNHHAESKVA